MLRDPFGPGLVLGARMLALAALFVGLLKLASGCGPGALGAQADTIAGAAVVWTSADAAIVTARARELDAIVDAARAECEPTGCSEERREYYRQALAAGEARWAPVLACRAPVPEALSTWLDSVDAAREAGRSGTTMLMRLGGRFALTYTAFATCVNEASPSDANVAIPTLGPELTELAEQLTARTSGGEAGAQ